MPWELPPAASSCGLDSVGAVRGKQEENVSEGWHFGNDNVETRSVVSLQILATKIEKTVELILRPYPLKPRGRMCKHTTCNLQEKRGGVKGSGKRQAHSLPS